VFRLLVASVAVLMLAVVGAESGSTSPTRGKQLKVGLVGSSFSEGDPIQRDAIAGLRRAVSELGVTARVRTPTPREGFAASYAAFAAQRYDLVIGMALNAFAIERVAPRSRRVRFAALDLSRTVFPNPPPNLTGLVFRRQEAGYLAGYLAGLVEQRRPGRDVVSAIGGERQPGVDGWVAGFRAGAKRAAPGIRFLYSYSHTYTAKEACAAIASNQIAKGSGVVFSVAGICGIGGLQTAARRHVWGVGVDRDQSSLGPHILTSAVLHVGVGVLRAIRALSQGRYRNGVDMEFGLKEGGVGLGRVSPRIPRSFRASLARTRRQIVSGKIVVPATL
jgi:basic membrane protein A